MKHRKRQLFFQTIRQKLTKNPYQAVPLLKDFSHYGLSQVPSDLKAALNVALLALPQGMAYAAIAGLPIVNGIICSAVAALVAPFFAGSRHTILGPTNATSFMLFSFFLSAQHLQINDLVPLIVLLVGLLSLLGALFKVADLLQYISRSVLVGYISGAAVLIIANQWKHILGIEASGRTFIHLASDLIRHLPETSWQPFCIGAFTLTLYFFLQKKYARFPTFAITLVLVSTLTWSITYFLPGLNFQEVHTFEGFGLDAFAPKWPSLGSFPNLYEALSELLLISFAIAFLASLENTVMAKTLSSQTGMHADVNQDMLAVGFANTACSCLAGMPASGSLTRSALNYSSGATSRFSSIYCGIFCLLGAFLLALTPLVTFVPKSCLAALVVGIALSLINTENIRICLRSTPGDAVVLLVTFVSALIAPLYIAIFIGVALSILLFLRNASQPHLIEYAINEEGGLNEVNPKKSRPNPAISIVHVEGNLFFGASEIFRSQIQRTIKDENLKIIILRLKNARHLDATSVMALSDLIQYTRALKRHIIISGATREVYRILKRSGVLEFLQEGCNQAQGESNLFMHSPSNPNISTRDALKRCQQILGTKEADIQIFYDPTKDQSNSD